MQQKEHDDDDPKQGKHQNILTFVQYQINLSSIDHAKSIFNALHSAMRTNWHSAVNKSLFALFVSHPLKIASRCVSFLSHSMSIDRRKKYDERFAANVHR
jgi:hypothetical protein